MMEDIFAKSEKFRERERRSLKIISDLHEKNSLVISELISLGVDVELKKLEVGDYIINGVVIERKTMNDFVSSMLNKRLRIQLENLKRNEKSLLIIEDFDVEQAKVNPNCVRGFIMSILLNYRIPIIFTRDSKDTADYLCLLAKKQERGNESLRLKRKPMSKEETARYILEGFPGVGPKTAKKLLKRFGSIKNIVNASKEELEKELGKKAGEFICIANFFSQNRQ